MMTEKQIDQTIAELHDGIRSLDIWDALWLMGVQAKQAIDLAAENERLKNTLNSIEFILQTQNDGADKTSLIRDLMAKHYRQGR